MDLRTLFLAQTCMLAALAAMLWLDRGRMDDVNGLRLWRQGQTFQALAFLLLALPALPPLLAGLAGNAAGALCVALLYAAIAQHTGHRVRRAPLALMVTVVTLVGGLAGRHYVIATAFNGGVYAVYELLNARALWRHQPDSRVQRIVALFYVAMGTVLPLRDAILLLTVGTDRSYLDLPAVIDAPVYVFGFIYLIVTNVGFLLLCKARAEAAASQQAHTDHLTGLPNRRALDEALQCALQQARSDRTPLAVLVADLDHFKAVNDQCGHSAGDEALVAVAARLTDRLPPQGRAFRYGGEEFCVLLPGHDPDAAQGVAEALRLGLALPAQGDRPALTASVGLAVWQPGDGDDDLFDRADRALYRAKAQGRNRVVAA